MQTIMAHFWCAKNTFSFHSENGHRNQRKCHPKQQISGARKARRNYHRHLLLLVSSLLREKSVLSAIETVGCRPPAPHPRPSSSFGTTIIMSSGWLCANEKKSLLCDDSVTELWRNCDGKCQTSHVVMSILTSDEVKCDEHGCKIHCTSKFHIF